MGEGSGVKVMTGHVKDIRRKEMGDTFLDA